MIKKFTAAERDLIDSINSANELAMQVYYGLKKDDEIVRNIKYEGENKGQYGYYVSHCAGQLFVILHRMKIKSIIDLGCGAHILGNVLNHFGSRYTRNSNLGIELNMEGYEIEEKLVKEANSMYFNQNVRRKDILKLESRDLNPYQAVYFWEPLADPKLAKQFVENLEKVMPPNKYIFYVCAGAIGTFLKESKRFKPVRNDTYSYIQIYKS